MKHGIEEISEGLTRLLGEAETLLQAAVDGTGRKLDRTDEEVRETLQRVCGHLRNARSEVVEGARKIDGAVRSHPWQALATTAIVSFFAGLLVRRR